MKNNNIKINTESPIVIITLSEYEYLKSLEDSIKHPERYKNNDDPDYLSPEEIVQIYETNKKISKGDFSDYVSLSDYKKSLKTKEKKQDSNALLIGERKNVYRKTGKKGSKIS